jgi:DNA-binding NarL/FixJ family response regulator
VAIALRIDEPTGIDAGIEPTAAVVGSETASRGRIAATLAGAGWSIAAATTRAEHAAALCGDARLGAVIVRINLGRRDAAVWIGEAREAFPEAAVVVVTEAALGYDVRRALRAGACGVVMEPDLEVTLPATLQATSVGLVAVPCDLRDHVTRPVLSHREKQILTLVAAGATNSEIAERLYLAESTVKNHLSSVFVKLGVRSRAEAATAALDQADSLLEQVSRAPSLQASHLPG